MSNLLKEKIEQLIKREHELELLRQKERDEDNKKYTEINKLRNEFINKYLTIASRKEYLKWLEGYIKENNPTHYYDYDFDNRNFYIARKDFLLDIAFYGSSLLNIIIPKNITATIEEEGHCNLFYMDGFRTNSNWIPVYKDLII